MRKWVLLFVIVVVSVHGGDFKLKTYDKVAIATDLEPDDVLALKLLFDEAARLDTFPIALIIVGEGNTAIKKKRMERLLELYFPVPEGVKIPIVEGRGTEDNLFIYDGHELFSEDVGVPYRQNGDTEAIAALERFVASSSSPLLIQLKPASELYFLKNAAHLDVIFYGGFNVRKTATQCLPTDSPFEMQLTEVMNHFGKKFGQVAIVETYGVLGESPAISQGNAWSMPIIEQIEASEEPFFLMFRKLATLWNDYLFDKKLTRSKEMIDAIVAGEKDQLTNLQRDIHFLYRIRPSEHLQFTPADVLVALALIDDSDLFQRIPITVSYNKNGYLTPSPTPSSNIFTFSRINKNTLVTCLSKHLK